MTIGIALSGGGARGVAHIGVLQALHEIGVVPTHVSGSSAGALIGALYCAGRTPEELLELSGHRSFHRIFHFGLIHNGLTEARFLEEFLAEHLADIRFEALPTPLFAGVTNIDTGAFELISTGPVMPAVMASCALPVLFRPYRMNGNLYVDGGVTNNLPIEPLEQLCDVVIGVGVCPHDFGKRVDGIWEIGHRAFQLAIWNTMDARMERCDIALDIPGMDQFGLFQLDKAQELFERGYKAVMDEREKILQRVQA